MWYPYLLLQEMQRAIRIWLTPYSLNLSSRWALKAIWEQILQFSSESLGCLQLSKRSVQPLTAILTCSEGCLEARWFFFFLIMAAIYQSWWLFQRRRGALPSPSETHLVQVVNEGTMSLLKFLIHSSTQEGGWGSPKIRLHISILGWGLSKDYHQLLNPL